MGSIKQLLLRGTKYEMGVQYGREMKDELNASLLILKDFFMIKHSISWVKLIQKANIFYDKYPYSYQKFIKGVSDGASITFDGSGDFDVKGDL